MSATTSPVTGTTGSSAQDQNTESACAVRIFGWEENQVLLVVGSVADPDNFAPDPDPDPA